VTAPAAPARPAPARSIRLGGAAYPLVLPSLRDPRLHVAAVIITVHVLGQVGLHFRVSIPQILAAILTTALIEVAITFRQTRMFVWPASAMLTGSGVALILRVVGTPPDQPWNTDGWYVFAGVAAFSLVTKYVIKYRGSHVFNPSNIGLVVAFIVLGSSRVEPLDFWWAPLNVWMITAYAVIIGGGLLITRRLRLLGLAATFWVALTIGVGLLAASGHCMTANWAFAPVCGFDFWRVIITSPEVMIFLFFMITDPKTVPAGTVGRVVFGLLVAIASTLLLAPMTDEFGTKVALLSGLVAVCAARPIVDRLVPEPKSAGDDLRGFGSRLVRGDAGVSLVRAILGVGLIGVAVLVLGAGIVVAGSPSRLPVGAVAGGEALDRVPHAIDPSTFPPITVEPDVTDWNHEIAGPGAQAIALTLAENLELENQALLRGDDAILTAVDHGDRLTQMRHRMADVKASGRTVIAHYLFDSMNVRLIVPFGVQTGLSLGFDSRGTVTEETYDATGALISREEKPFAQTFVVRRATGDRWLNVAELPLSR
jgi:Na+-translocating ferredoxin:NAD+ oxidoreductase RnfD subunit